MNLRPRRREDPEVNLTPLIDVVFLLLIFFMISTTFDREAELRVELPQATAEPGEPPPELLEITVNARGQYFVNDQQVVNSQPQTLKRAMQQVLAGRKELPVVIRSDGQAPYQAVVTVMDVARQLGLSQLSLATTQTPAE
ncbi:biopolymer transporter ExbD [Thiohalobacter sp. IOR34]|uniref:ExbD/TolR family protein n=1 Tax=Thiohalobacter sp. IOR34 TaxID=3057176 RepID=UPI0025B25345|nr:biopolymer transporter ExbD [Thiohalobacter sp. IOR34]WJW76779.1 biopolymer transporter ExbD [Thiohalobacter sp. IOR34]